LRSGRNSSAFVHLTLVPYLPYAGELKTKPTQHSVQKLREIGISPDALLCRADRRIPDDERAKISLFSNVQQDAVISVWDADTIYKIPQMLHDQGLDRIICDKLDLNVKGADLSMWSRLITALENPKHEVCIAMVGKYVDLTESYINRSPRPCATRVFTLNRGWRLSMLIQKRSKPRASPALPSLMRFWCRVDLANVGLKEKLQRFVTRVSIRCLISAFALVCKWR